MAKPALTKQDFEAIAATLLNGFKASRSHCPASQHPALQAIHNAACSDIADTLAKTNPKFDRIRFLGFCGFTAR